MDREQDSSWFLGGWNFLCVPTLISAATYCSAVAVQAHPLLVDGVLWCQGDLFSKELKIHSGRPDQQVAKTTLMPLQRPQCITVRFQACLQLNKFPQTLCSQTSVHHKRHKQGQRPCILASLTTEYHPPHWESSVWSRGWEGEGGRTLHSALCDCIILHRPVSFSFVLLWLQNSKSLFSIQNKELSSESWSYYRQGKGQDCPLLYLYLKTRQPTPSPWHKLKVYTL